jgi:hypothetical protein
MRFLKRLIYLLLVCTNVCMHYIEDTDGGVIISHISCGCSGETAALVLLPKFHFFFSQGAELLAVGIVIKVNTNSPDRLAS